MLSQYGRGIVRCYTDKRYRTVARAIGRSMLNSFNPSHGSYDEGRVKTISFLSGVFPLYGRYVQAKDNIAQMEDTMRLYGFDYDDIKYISKTGIFAGYSGYGSIARDSINYVSSNVKDLYR